MLDSSFPESIGSAPMPLFAAADLQDNLMTATHDLERLQALLSHACDELMGGFYGAVDRIREYADGGEATERTTTLFASLTEHLGAAVTALQFQDMASQLIAHTNKRLRNCADRLAYETMGEDDDGLAVVEDGPLRPNPVTQDEMDAGSVELF